jgi:hypothetical protein
MSHHEENYDPRMYDMESHLYKVIYTPAFKTAFQEFFGEEMDRRWFHLWYGPIGSYWLQPGESKKYITLIVDYKNKKASYEQDSLTNPEGVFHTFRR